MTDERERVLYALASIRVFLGALWLSNLSWKLPPDFGKHDARGLLYSFRVAERHAVVSPLRNLVHDVVIPNFTAFGYLVFAIEAVAGTLLLLGLFTKVGAFVGLLQSLAIASLVAGAPNSWKWGYAMLVLLNLIALATPVARRLSLDDRLGRDP